MVDLTRISSSITGRGTSQLALQDPVPNDMAIEKDLLSQVSALKNRLIAAKGFSSANNYSVEIGKAEACLGLIEAVLGKKRGNLVKKTLWFPPKPLTLEKIQSIISYLQLATTALSLTCYALRLVVDRNVNKNIITLERLNEDLYNFYQDAASKIRSLGNEEFTQAVNRITSVSF